MARYPKLRRLFRLDLGHADVERGIDDELQFHFDMTWKELMSQGLREEEARREAARRFGDVNAARESIAALDRQRITHERRAEWWRNVAQDLRYAVRGMRLNPAFTIAVVATLAIAIGANATMAGVVDRLLFRPPPLLANASEVNRLYFIRTIEGKESPTTNISYRRFLDMARFSRTSAESFAFYDSEIAIGTGEASREVLIGLATPEMWTTFRVTPALGRFFAKDEDKPPTGTAVAVLGFGFWQSEYGGRADVIGQTMQIGEARYTIIGVAPQGFQGMSPRPQAAFVPLTAGTREIFGSPDQRVTFEEYGRSWIEMAVRRKPGVSDAAATTDLTNAFIASYRLAVAQNPRAMPIDELRPRVVPGSAVRERGPQQSQESKVSLWLVGVTLVVLLIACANVANLLLARALRRQREIAVRLALGVSRKRLVSQLMTESVVLALTGGAVGLALAQWGGRMLNTLLLGGRDAGNALTDPRILTLTLVVTLLCGLLGGLLPALHISRPGIIEALKAGGREGNIRRSRTRSGLLVVQGALSVVLLVGAGLFVRSLNNALSVHLGYDPEHVVLVSPQWRGYPITAALSMTIKNDLTGRALALPGVEAVGRSESVPFQSNIVMDLFTAGVDSVNRLGEFYYHAVTPGYFAAMGTKAVRGRLIEEQDRAGSQPVMVVSEGMSKRIWKGADPIGKCVKVDADTVPCSMVVGVVENIRRGSLDEVEDPGLQYYVASAQTSRPAAGRLFIRVKGDGAASAEGIRRALQPAMPGASYLNVESLGKIVSGNVQQWKLGATMFTAFGVVALLLAAIGLYGVIAYNVAQRRHELAVRVALGANGSRVMQLVVKEGVLIAAAGVVVGGIIAVASTRFVSGLLFKVSPYDPTVFVSVAAALFVVATIASVVPARRASRVDPIDALRGD